MAMSAEGDEDEVHMLVHYARSWLARHDHGEDECRRTEYEDFVRFYEEQHGPPGHSNVHDPMTTHVADRVVRHRPMWQQRFDATLRCTADGKRHRPSAATTTDGRVLASDHDRSEAQRTQHRLEAMLLPFCVAAQQRAAANGGAMPPQPTRGSNSDDTLSARRCAAWLCDNVMSAMRNSAYRCDAVPHNVALRRGGAGHEEAVATMVVGSAVDVASSFFGCGPSSHSLTLEQRVGAYHTMTTVQKLCGRLVHSCCGCADEATKGDDVVQRGAVCACGRCTLRHVRQSLRPGRSAQQQRHVAERSDDDSDGDGVTTGRNSNRWPSTRIEACDVLALCVQPPLVGCHDISAAT